MIVYKYLRKDTALKVIETNSVLLKTPLEFNDPFDCFFYVSPREKKKAIRLLYNYEFFNTLYTLFVQENKKPVRFKANIAVAKKNIEMLVPKIQKTGKYKYQFDLAVFYKVSKMAAKIDETKNKEKFDKQIKDALNLARQSALVSCFSLSYDSILMWSHYADNHSGVCLEFEIDDENFKQVNYKRRMKTFKLTKFLELMLGHKFAGKDIEFDKKSFMFILNPIFEKSCVWSYEKEVRCAFGINVDNKNIYKDKDGKTFFKMSKIKRIFIGCNADKGFLKEIKKINRSIPINRMKIIDGKYKVIPSD